MLLLLALMVVLGAGGRARGGQFQQQGVWMDQAGSYRFENGGRLFAGEFRAVFGPLATAAVQREGKR